MKHLQYAGKILAQALDRVQCLVKPGVTTQELDQAAEKYIRKHGAMPSFQGYQGSSTDPPFPSTLCASVNNEVVHTPASERRVKDGDIIGLDIGLKIIAEGKEYYVDMARTVAVGKISHEAERLITVTQTALAIGIEHARSGKYIHDIGKAIQEYVETNGFSVVRQLVGHGVGFAVHEKPRIPNYYTKDMPVIEIVPGMVLAIEPMVNIGGYEIEILDDGWTAVTADGSLSAHFEHTIAVTVSGAEILTQ